MLDPDGYVCGFVSRYDKVMSCVVLGKGFTQMEYGPITKPKRSKRHGKA